MRICQVAKPTIINQIHTKLLAAYFTVPRTMPSGDDAVAATMPVYDAVRRRCRQETMPLQQRCRFTMPSGDDAVAATMPSTGRCRYTMPSGDDAVPATMKDKARDNRSDQISTAYEGVLETILQSE